MKSNQKRSKSLILITLFTIFLTLFNSCGGSSSNRVAKKQNTPSFLESNLTECDLRSRNRFLYSFLQDAYYWADEVPKGIDPSRFNSEDELLQKLKNKKDRFSFILDLDLYAQTFESQTSEDFGILSDLDEENNYRVVYVSPNSPASKAGIKRSDRYEVLKGLSEDNRSVKLRIYSKYAPARTVTLYKKSFLKKEVGYEKIFTINGKKVGYFVLNSFVGERIDRDLDQLFADFKREGIDDLIVDLRYNGGGNIDISAHLATLISGQKSFSHIFQHHQFNRKYSKYNDNSYFDRYSPYALDMKRVFFITTENTASASESIISALRARENGMSVIIIGSKTYGKPYSMLPIKFCNKVLFPIMMKNFNVDYDEDYDDGFSPTCEALDDKDHNFGDIKERSLNESLYYIEFGYCQ